METINIMISRGYFDHWEFHFMFFQATEIQKNPHRWLGELSQTPAFFAHPGSTRRLLGLHQPAVRIVLTYWAHKAASLG